MLLLVFGRQARTIRCGPSRLEANASPDIWEVDIEEQSTKLVFPVVVMHHESSVIFIGVKLLIRWQRGDIVFNVLLVLLALLALVGPGKLPL